MRSTFSYTNFPSFTQIPVNELSEMLESPIEPHHYRGELLEATSLFVWDEAPMANRAAVACADDLMRRITGHDTLFGGKVMVQTCPVIRGGTRRQVVDASIRSRSLWNNIVVRGLTVPIRNARDPEYADFVDAIGDGAGPDITVPAFVKSLPHKWTLSTLPSRLTSFSTPSHPSVVPSLLRQTNKLMHTTA